MCVWCSGNTTSFQVVVGSSNLPTHSIPANHRRFMGHSFNGRTVALQASNEGSTPSWSTSLEKGHQTSRTKAIAEGCSGPRKTAQGLVVQGTRNRDQGDALV